jgi:PIN domain nuclease of toxin-antitoxin system
MIVADTCVVLWLAADPGILSKAAKAAVLAARDNGGIAIADITLYELAWLIQNQRVSVTGSAETFLATVESRFVVLPLTAAIARLATELPVSYPADPMDRLIGATALASNLPLVTRDKAIRRAAPFPVIW